jgi:hypothetical protein
MATFSIDDSRLGAASSENSWIRRANARDYTTCHARRQQFDRL